MLSPLAPRMMTVSDSRPSYMLVWYIATPLLQVHSDRCGHRYLCDQAEETAWRVYCHKLAQESKPDYIHTTGADVFPACQGSCRVSRPLQKRRRGPHLLTQGEVFRRPASLPVADDQRGGSVRVPSQAQVKSAMRGGRLARKYTCCRRMSVRPARAIAASGLGSSAAWQKQKTPWAAS